MAGRREAKYARVHYNTISPAHLLAVLRMHSSPRVCTLVLFIFYRAMSHFTEIYVIVYNNECRQVHCYRVQKEFKSGIPGNDNYRDSVMGMGSGVSVCANLFINHASCIPSLSCLPFLFIPASSLISQDF